MKLHFVLVLLLAVCAMDCESKLGGKSKKTKSSEKSSKSAKEKKSVVIIATIETNNILQKPVSNELKIKVVTDVNEAIGSAFQQNTRKLQDNADTNLSVTTKKGNKAIETSQTDFICNEELPICNLSTSTILIIVINGLIEFAEDFFSPQTTGAQEALNEATNTVEGWKSSEVTASFSIEPTMAPIPDSGPIEPTMEPIEPTMAPIPDSEPIEPTMAPIAPTMEPIEPTMAPIPDSGPIEPTMEPFEPNMDMTSSPM